MENMTMEEMKYKLVNGSGIDEVSEISNKLMDEGYVPAGGINYIPNEHLYTQVMFWEPKSITGTL
jgi:hypothetical protein